jgi:DNA-directed RNA polymerase subunit alpha
VHDGRHLRRSGEDEAVNKNLFRKIEELELCIRCANNLDRANIQYVGELAQLTEQDLLTKNFGKKSCHCMKVHLANMGLSLGMKIDHWPEMLERWKRRTMP